MKNRLIEVETAILDMIREKVQEELDVMDGFYTTQEIADEVLIRLKDKKVKL